LKREALIFRRLASLLLDESIRRLADSEDERCRFRASDLEWLATNGILFEPDYSPVDEFLDYTEYRERLRTEVGGTKVLVDTANRLADYVQSQCLPKKLPLTDKHFQDELRKLKAQTALWDEYAARRISIQLSLAGNADAYPIISNTLLLPEHVQTAPADPERPPPSARTRTHRSPKFSMQFSVDPSASQLRSTAVRHKFRPLVGEPHLVNLTAEITLIEL